MTRDEIEDLFEAVTGHNIAHGEKSEGRAMYLSPDEVLEFANLIVDKHNARLSELQTLNEQLLDILELLVDEALYDGAYLGKND